MNYICFFIWWLYMIFSLSSGIHLKLSPTSSLRELFLRHFVIFSLRLHFFIFCNPSLSVSAIHLSHSFSHKHLHLQDAFIYDQQWSLQSVYIIDTFAFINRGIKNMSDFTRHSVINLQWNWMVRIQHNCFHLLLNQIDPNVQRWNLAMLGFLIPATSHTLSCINLQ